MPKSPPRKRGEHSYPLTARLQTQVKKAPSLKGWPRLPRRFVFIVFQLGEGQLRNDIHRPPPSLTLRISVSRPEDASVGNRENPVCLQRNSFIVGDEQKRLSVFFVGRLEQIHDFTAGPAVQIAGGSVCRINAGSLIRALPIDTRCCCPSRELAGQMIPAVFPVLSRTGVDSVFPYRAAVCPAAGEHDVFLSSEREGSGCKTEISCRYFCA